MVLGTTCTLYIHPDHLDQLNQAVRYSDIHICDQVDLPYLCVIPYTLRLDFVWIFFFQRYGTIYTGTMVASRTSAVGAVHDGLSVFVRLSAVPCRRLCVWSTSGVCLRPCAARPYAPWASCVCTVPSCHPPPQSYALSRAFCCAHPPLLPLFSFLLVFVACLGLSAYHSVRHRYSSASD